MSRFLCQFAQMIHEARSWNNQLLESLGQRSRSREAEDRFGEPAKASFSIPVELAFSTPLGRVALLVQQLARNNNCLRYLIPLLRLTSRKPLWLDLQPVDIKGRWRHNWKSAQVVNSHLVCDPTIRQSDDVWHCRILSPDKTEWRLISATFCRWRRCFVADQLWFMTHIQEEEVGSPSLDRKL